MSDLIRACLLADIPQDRALGVTVDGIKIALVRHEDTVYAIKDACSHADVALSEGEVSGCFLECWLHGSQFDLRTGQPTSLPAIEPVPIYDTVVIQHEGLDEVHIKLTPLTAEEISQRHVTSN
jgi:3-phenylpropionate/trans-cinnamate dioxygenase ferredoxin component